MKQKTFKNIRTVCIIALVMCGIWALVMLGHFLTMSLAPNHDFFGKMVGLKIMDWSTHTTAKIIYFILYVISTIVMIWLCVKAVCNILKGIKEGVVFPKSNVKLFYWLALADFIYMAVNRNSTFLYGFNSIYFNHDNFTTPFIILILAMMYKVASQAVEENNLTI